MKFKYCNRPTLHICEPSPSFFKPPRPLNMMDEFKKIGCGILAGLSMGGYALLIFSIIHVTLAPWLLLVAAPYFLVGARGGYAMAGAIIDISKKKTARTAP